MTSIWKSIRKRNVNRRIAETFAVREPREFEAPAVFGEDGDHHAGERLLLLVGYGAGDRLGIRFDAGSRG